MPWKVSTIMEKKLNLSVKGEQEITPSQNAVAALKFRDQQRIKS